MQFFSEKFRRTMKTNYTERAVRIIAAHPYLCAFLVCVGLNPFFFGSVENIPNNVLEIIAFLISGFLSVVLIKKYKTGELSRLRSVFIGICSFVILLCLMNLFSGSEYKSLWYLTGGCITVFLLYCFSDRKTFREQMNAFLILGTGFMMKLYYVLETSVYTRQHDVYVFDGNIGHAGYIEYIIQNFNVADFDIRERWQFCHPPLHHILSAAWIYINENFFLVGHSQARESIQMLTLFYSMCIIISAYKIFRYFGLKGKALYIPLAVVSFHPAFIIFSGSINNDVLSAAFMMGAFLCALNWYREQSMKNILKTALCTGLGMMTKLTAALVAPPVAVIFAVVFFKNLKTDFRKLLVQFTAFLLVCAPLGLWYEIRNYVKWGVPLLYVQELDPRLLQYIGNQDFISRITDFSVGQFKSVFEQWAVWHDDTCTVSGYNEFNPLIALFKTSLFGEYINESVLNNNLFIIKVSEILFWLTVIMAAVSLICMVMMFSGERKTEKAAVVVFFFCMIFNFYKMSYDYPFTCTMNFRYITPTVFTGALCSGIVLSRYEGRKRFAGYISEAAAAVFVFCTVIIYTGLCITE